ncbi:ThiF family adenylyltransferase, partial [candidate division KSB1 bacterium]
MNLFTHEQEYRTEKLMKKLATTPLTVCGCGAIGSNLIDNLSRQGFKNITVIDMDRIESHNIGTQIWEKREAGAFKTQRMKNRVYAINGSSLNAISTKIIEENIRRHIKKGHIIIDSFDNSYSRGLIYNYCKNENINCLHAGLYQDYAEVIWNENYIVPKDPNGLDICEYPLARNIVMLSVILTSEILIRFIETNKKYNYIVTLKDLKIKELEK